MYGICVNLVSSAKKLNSERAKGIFARPEKTSD